MVKHKTADNAGTLVLVFNGSSSISRVITSFCSQGDGGGLGVLKFADKVG